MNLRILETEGKRWVIVGYNNNQIGESYRTKAEGYLTRIVWLLGLNRCRKKLLKNDY